MPGLTTVLITHHVEEVAASTTDVLMVKDGGVLASGPMEQVMTAENLGVLYDMDVQLERVRGRWFAFSDGDGAFGDGPGTLHQVPATVTD